MTIDPEAHKTTGHDQLKVARKVIIIFRLWLCIWMIFDSIFIKAKNFNKQKDLRW